MVSNHGYALAYRGIPLPPPMVAALLDSHKPFIEASREGFAVRLIRIYGRASMPSHAAATFLDLPPRHKSVTAFNALLAAYVDSGDFDKLVAAFQVR